MKKEKTQVEDVSESSSEVVDAETKSEVSETISLEGKTDEASEEKSETKSEATSEDESGTKDTTVQTETVDEVDSNTDNGAEKKTVTKTVEKGYYTISNSSNYLYTTAANNGIRVGSMPSDKTGAQWDVDSATGYLCAIDPFIGSGEHGFDVLRTLEKETLLHNNQLVKIKDLFIQGIKDAPQKYAAGSIFLRCIFLLQHQWHF